MTAIEGELDGNLAAQLAKPIARARAASALLVGAGTLKASRVHLDEEALEDYLRAMPELVRTIALRIADGTPPRALVLEGAAEASLVEDLVCDLASRGVVAGIEDEDGKDLFGPEVARLAQHTDTRASFAPRTATPSPLPAGAGAPASGVIKAASECSADSAGDLCGSPIPGDVNRARRGRDAGHGSLEDAVLREVALSSPEPAKLTLPTQHEVLASPEPAAYEPEGTPPHDQILAMGEATIVDDTSYAEKSVEPSIAVEMDSLPLPPSESRAAKTPLTTVTTHDNYTPVPKRRAWPMVAFVTATGVVAWAVMHFSAGGVAKHVETAPPAQAQTALPGSNEEVTYTAIANGAEIPAGHGVINVSAPGDAIILVDGIDRGRGAATLSLWAGSHDVRLSTSPGDGAKLIAVQAGRVAHVKF